MTLAELPDVLTLPELAAFVRRKVGGIRKDLQAGIFVPVPFATRPYRWRKADVQRWYEGRDDNAEARLRRIF